MALGAAPGGDAAPGDAAELADGAGVGETRGGGVRGLPGGGCPSAGRGSQPSPVRRLHQCRPFFPVGLDPAPIQLDSGRMGEFVHENAARVTRSCRRSRNLEPFLQRQVPGDGRPEARIAHDRQPSQRHAPEVTESVGEPGAPGAPWRPGRWHAPDCPPSSVTRAGPVSAALRRGPGPEQRAAILGAWERWVLIRTR